MYLYKGSGSRERTASCKTEAAMHALQVALIQIHPCTKLFILGRKPTTDKMSASMEWQIN